MCGLCFVYVQLWNSSNLVIGTVRFVHGVTNGVCVVSNPSCHCDSYTIDSNVIIVCVIVLALLLALLVLVLVSYWYQYRYQYRYWYLYWYPDPYFNDLFCEAYYQWIEYNRIPPFLLPPPPFLPLPFPCHHYCYHYNYWYRYQYFVRNIINE